jgi:D-xylose transport system substrate-binding protein
MTVYKSAKEEVGALAKLAIGLTKGEKGETTGTTRDDTGNRDVPSVLLTPKSVTQATVKDVIADGGQSKADVCTGSYAALCTKYGVS